MLLLGDVLVSDFLCCGDYLVGEAST